MEALPRQESVFDAVYVAIRDSICEGDLAPGERITQDELAERLGVSRQPVAQALILLKSQGFVSETGRRGVVVATLDTEMVQSIYEIRGSLDGLAARLAARRASADDVGRGEEILAHGRLLVETGNVRQLVKADIAFHEFVYELSGNALIRQALSAHWQHLRRVMAAVIEQPDYRGFLWDEHAGILDAIRNGDEAEAGAQSERHVAAASQALQNKIAQSDMTGTRASA